MTTRQNRISNVTAGIESSIPAFSMPFCLLPSNSLFRLSGAVCSTVKSASQRQKLSLKTFSLPMTFFIKSSAFCIYAIIFAVSLTSVCTILTIKIFIFFPCYFRFCRKAKNESEVFHNERVSKRCFR